MSGKKKERTKVEAKQKKIMKKLNEKEWNSTKEKERANKRNETEKKVEKK